MAVHAADGDRVKRLRSRAGGESCWHLAGKLRGQIANERVSVNALEQVVSAVARVANFESGVLGDLALDAQAVGMNLVRPEVRTHVGFGEGPRIKHSQGYGGCDRRSYVRPCRHCGQSMGSRRGQALQENHGRRGGFIDKDVVVRRVIEEAVSAAYGGFAVAGKEATPLRVIGKTQAGPEAVLD